MIVVCAQPLAMPAQGHEACDMRSIWAATSRGSILAMPAQGHEACDNSPGRHASRNARLVTPARGHEARDHSAGRHDVCVTTPAQRHGICDTIVPARRRDFRDMREAKAQCPCGGMIPATSGLRSTMPVQGHDTCDNGNALTPPSLGLWIARGVRLCR